MVERNNKENQDIEFKWEGKKYKAKNIKDKQEIKDEDGKNMITVKDLEKKIFWTSASINENSIKPIKYHLFPILGTVALILALCIGLLWFLVNRKNRKQRIQEEDEL